MCWFYLCLIKLFHSHSYSHSHIHIHRCINYTHVLINIIVFHIITVVSEGSFISGLCLIRDEYTVSDNCTLMYM